MSSCAGPAVVSTSSMSPTRTGSPPPHRPACSRSGRRCRPRPHPALRAALAEWPGQPDQSFSIRNRSDSRKVQDHAALMGPMAMSSTSRGSEPSGPRPRAPACLLRKQPKALPVGELFRKVGENLGEDFAFASLGSPNPRQPNPCSAAVISAAGPEEHAQA